MQKSLHWLDNVTAEGTEEFDSVLTIIETLLENGVDEQWVQATQQAIKEGKRYLKTDFKAHVSRDESCNEHCTVHALSDPGNVDFREDCQHCHDTEYDRCEPLEVALEEVSKKLENADMNEEQRARFDF